MENIRFAKALIEWDTNPSKFPVNKWLRDIIVTFDEIIGKQLLSDSWTLLVYITRFIENTWDTNADVAFIVEEAPWQLLEKGLSFKLRHGRDIATVTII